MKAMYTNAPDQVELRDIGKPVRWKDEALLKLLCGGVYRSDLGSYKGTFTYFDYSKTPGHEFSAEIVEVDEDNEQGLRPGMIVTCNPYFNCGHCYSCEHGTVNTCMDNQIIGCQRDGAFQEYITMPEERMHDGKGLDSTLLTTIKLFCAGYHGVSRAEVKLGDKVLVMRAGTVGVPVAVAAKAKGAVVYMLDASMGKLDVAREFSTDGIILNDSLKGSNKAVKEIIDRSGSDITTEAVGLPSTFRNCIDVVCFGGKVVVIGAGRKNLNPNSTSFRKKELSVFDSRSALKKDFTELIDLVKEGGVSVKGIVTNVYEFGDEVKVFDGFANDPEDMLEVALDFTDR